MFKLFKKKSEIDQLEEDHKRVLEQAYKLSKTDRRASDAKHQEAAEIVKKIEQLETNK